MQRAGQRRAAPCRFPLAGTSLYSVIMDNQSWQVVIDEERGDYSILIDGALRRAGHGRAGDAHGAAQGVLPGGSGEVQAHAGVDRRRQGRSRQEVRQGDTCIILESMKMQNELKTPVDGIVQAVKVQAGQTVDKDDVLVLIAPPADVEE